MGSTGNRGGQRSNLTSASGRKERSPTNSAHSGSRADPSHTTRKARDERTQKAATQQRNAAKKTVKKK